MSLASIGTIASCLMIVGIFYCIAVNVDYVRNFRRNYRNYGFYTKKSRKKNPSLENRLNQIDHIEKIVYISPEEALNKKKKSGRMAHYWKD